MQIFGWYALAALGELGGCFAFWAVVRGGKSAWWLPTGVAALCIFALALTRVDVSLAGRAFAAYGGLYIIASLGWLRVVEGIQPDRWDVAGGLVCLMGAALLAFGPR